MNEKKQVLEKISWSEDLIKAFLEDDRVPSYGFSSDVDDTRNAQLITTSDTDTLEFSLSASANFNFK
jgi:hypothetical protein